MTFEKAVAIAIVGFVSPFVWAFFRALLLGAIRTWCPRYEAVMHAPLGGMLWGAAKKGFRRLFRGQSLQK
jgi:hypothetical protein